MAAIQANYRDYLSEFSAPCDDDLKVKFVSFFKQTLINLVWKTKIRAILALTEGKTLQLKLHNSRDLQGFHSSLCLHGNSSGNWYSQTKKRGILQSSPCKHMLGSLYEGERETSQHLRISAGNQRWLRLQFRRQVIWTRVAKSFQILTINLTICLAGHH